MTSLLPKILQDESNLALEKIAAEAFELDLKPFVFFVFDRVNARFLPYLAEMFHIRGNEGWNLCQNETEKRKLLKKTFYLHKKKGTKAALKDVLGALNLNGRILEWFEYEGEPYHFKIILNILNRTLDEETENLLLALVMEYKNVRSHLDTIEKYLTSKLETSVYTRILRGKIVTIKKKEL